MELLDGIKRVSKLAAITKKEAAYIRFLPRSDPHPAVLFTTDGTCSAIVRVQGDVPNALIEASVLVKASRGEGAMRITQAGYGQYQIEVGSARYQVQGRDLSGYPGLPPIPEELEEVRGWGWVLGAMHAAEPERSGGPMSCIHFTSEYVESCDAARVARAELTGPWGEALVPKRLFKSWPKGAVKAKFSPTHAVFSIGMEELRVGCLSAEKYPDTSGLVPAVHGGPWVLVETEALRRAVLLGRQVSYLGMVFLEMTSQRVVVQAAQADERAHRYVSDLPVLHAPRPAQGGVFVLGKYLLDALSKIETPNLKLCWGAPLDPLRIEAGPLVICIWQISH